jgi:hypothetical protein
MAALLLQGPPNGSKNTGAPPLLLPPARGMRTKRNALAPLHSLKPLLPMATLTLRVPSLT